MTTVRAEVTSNNINRLEQHFPNLFLYICLCLSTHCTLLYYSSSIGWIKDCKSSPQNVHFISK